LGWSVDTFICRERFRSDGNARRCYYPFGLKTYEQALSFPPRTDKDDWRLCMVSFLWDPGYDGVRAVENPQERQRRVNTMSISFYEGCKMHMEHGTGPSQSGFHRDRCALCCNFGGYGPRTGVQQCHLRVAG
jgi:hypothetical protein